MDWLKIGSAAVLVMFLIVMFPRIKYAMTHSEKADSQAWMKAIIPLVALVLFVIILIKLV